MHVLPPVHTMNIYNNGRKILNFQEQYAIYTIDNTMRYVNTGHQREDMEKLEQ